MPYRGCPCEGKFVKRFCSALIVLLIPLAACNSNENERAETLQNRSVLAEAKPLREVLISDAELRRASAGSTERAFLEFWSLLQYQGWAAAVESYDPPLLAAIGSDRIAEALKTQAAYFRSARPDLRRSIRRRGRVTVRYLVANSAGNVVPQSMTWTRTSEGWRIFYDTLLDESLRQAAQRATQVRVDPTTDRTGPEAIRAGEAASRLQSRYLRTRLGQSGLR
jgi:hypothetical protein